MTNVLPFNCDRVNTVGLLAQDPHQGSAQRKYPSPIRAGILLLAIQPYLRLMETSLKTQKDKVELFGMTKASAEFLRGHQVYYWQANDIGNIFVELTAPGKSSMYILMDSPEQQLRVISLDHQEQGHTADADKNLPLPIAFIEDFIETELDEDDSQLVYQDHAEDPSSRNYLIHAAYDKAKSLGVTHATARWFGQYLVKDTFFGFQRDQEFTDNGFFIGTEGFGASYGTVKKQLNLLQNVGALNYKALPKQEGFYLKFNRQCLPTINHELLPQFFETLLF